MREQGGTNWWVYVSGTISISIKLVPVCSTINRIQLVPPFPLLPLGFCCFPRVCFCDFPILHCASTVFAEVMSWSPLRSHCHWIHNQLQVLGYLLHFTMPTTTCISPCLGLCRTWGQAEEAWSLTGCGGWASLQLVIHLGLLALEGLDSTRAALVCHA